MSIQNEAQLMLLLSTKEWKKLHNNLWVIAWGDGTYREARYRTQEPRYGLDWVRITHTSLPEPENSHTECPYVVRYHDLTRHCDDLAEACRYLVGNNLQPKPTDGWNVP